MDLKDFRYGNRVIVRVDNPAHGDYWANGMSGVVDSIQADPQDDHIRYEVTVRFDDESIGSILHYNLERDESASEESLYHDTMYHDTMYRDTPHHFDPDHPETRKLIDEFKETRLLNPYKAHAFEMNKQNPESAFKLWVEQVGDAELYHQAYKEGRAR